MTGLGNAVSRVVEIAAELERKQIATIKKIETGSVQIQKQNNKTVDGSSLQVTLQRKAKVADLPSASELTLSSLCDK